MTKLLHSPWVASGLGALLYWTVTVLVWQPVASHDSRSGKPSARTGGPSWTFTNPELAQLIEELKKEKEHLTQKEKELADLAARLNAERMELNQATQAIHALQLEFDRNVTRVEEQETANLKRLARMYASMGAEGAMPILKQMDEPTLIKILAIMKESEVAPILEAMGKQSEAEAKQAAVISERLRLAVAKPTSASPVTR